MSFLDSLLGLIISTDTVDDKLRNLHNEGKEVVETPQGFEVVERKEENINKVAWSLLSFLLGESKEE